jgi:small ligand-binding sensory domain FIST
VAVWAASFDDGAVEGFHADTHDSPEGLVVTGLPDLAGAAGALLLPDPAASRPTRSLADLAAARPASGAGRPGERPGRRGRRRPVLRREVVHGGPWACACGVELLPLVSQARTPLGPELTVTAADGHVIEELAGRPGADQAA